MLTFIVFVLVFGVLVLIHELGHFFVAKRSGVKVEEFGFGFPPRIWGIKRGETFYSINLLPLGGFVRLYGEDRDGSLKQSRRSFAAQSVWKRMLIVVAGVVMNLVLGFVIFAGLNMFGLPIASFEEPEVTARERIIEPFAVKVGGVRKNSPASEAGVDPGDTVLAVNGEQVGLARDLRALSCKFAGEKVLLMVARAGVPKTIDVETTHPVIELSSISPEAEGAGLMKGDRILSIDGEQPISAERSGEGSIEECFAGSFYRYTDESRDSPRKLVVERTVSGLFGTGAVTERIEAEVPLKGIQATEVRGAMGIEPIGVKIVRYPFFTAFANALKQTFIILANIFVGFVALLVGIFSRGELIEGAAGPVGIGLLLGQLVRLGPSFVFFFAAALSINLAVLNILPIPALDGGKIFFLSLEALRIKKISPKIENLIHVIGFVLLIALILFITYFDILRLF